MPNRDHFRSAHLMATISDKGDSLAAAQIFAALQSATNETGRGRD